MSTWNPPPIPSNPQLDYLSSLSCPFTLIPYVRPMPLEMGCDPASPDADSTACTHISSDITAPETQVYTFHGTLESITFNGETISPDAFNGKDLNSGPSFFQVGLALIENFRRGLDDIITFGVKPITLSPDEYTVHPPISSDITQLGENPTD